MACIILGWLKQLGAIDFAGGLVVHISSGVSGLVASWILGKRHDWGLYNSYYSCGS